MNAPVSFPRLRMPFSGAEFLPTQSIQNVLGVNNGRPNSVPPTIELGSVPGTENGAYKSIHCQQERDGSICPSSCYTGLQNSPMPDPVANNAALQSLSRSYMPIATANATQLPIRVNTIDMQRHSTPAAVISPAPIPQRIHFVPAPTTIVATSQPVSQVQQYGMTNIQAYNQPPDSVMSTINNHYGPIGQLIFNLVQE
ncbi:hypothetical protein ACOME3_003431 [Neoechinorhynchus agilis]